MKTIAAALLLMSASQAWAADKAQFAGRWAFQPARSENVGMMAAMEWTATIRQSATLLTERDEILYDGQAQTRETRCDLSWREVPNSGPMSESSVSQSKWDGSSLVTTWTSEGAVSGTRVVRIETRSLSADGRTMRVERRRGSYAPIVMVFVRK